MHYICNKRQCRQPSRAYWYCCRFCTYFGFNPEEDLVIVGSDTISILLPERNLGRYDRGLFNYLFIPKGQWAFGLTASYGEFNSEDVEVLSVIKTSTSKASYTL